MAARPRSVATRLAERSLARPLPSASVRPFTVVFPSALLDVGGVKRRLLYNILPPLRPVRGAAAVLLFWRRRLH